MRRILPVVLTLLVSNFALQHAEAAILLSQDSRRR
jgi:hypothetical protein